ncbi:MAG: hypothetical protein ACOYYU_00340 [Chloroflexota bacterium]
MADQSDLEKLYREAQTALKAKDYTRASELLRQILKADVDYKDAAQLLARVIQLSRRRWYNDPRTWGALGAILLVGLGIYLFPILRGLYRQPAPAPVILPTGTPAQTIVLPATATATLLPTPTSIPLTWKRISLGQEFPRDTVTAFTTDKKDPDVIYAGMKNGGVYKTIDGGLSWRPAHYGMANTQVESLLIDSQNPRILYASTMDGVYKTEDGGENWFRIGNGTYLLMDYQDNSHLYARDKNGIYETTDRGNTWTTVYPLNKDCPGTILSWAIHPADGNTLLAGGGEGCEIGLYQSDDGGRSWAWVEMDEEPPIYIDRLLIGIDKQGESSFYVSYQPGGFVVSYGAGLTWNSVGEVDFESATTDPDNSPPYFFGGNSWIWMTQGKGYPWQRIRLRIVTATAIHVDHYTGVERIIVGGARYSANFDDGIFISTDSGVAWAEYNNGLGSTRSELRLNPRDSSRLYLATYYPYPYLSGGSNQGCTIYRSSDSGKNWSSIYFVIDPGWCSPAFDGANDLYIMEGNSWQKSQDGGDHWWWALEGDKWRETYGNWDAHFSLPIASISVSANPYIPGLIYAIGDEIYYSTDAGESWQPSNGSKDLGDSRLFYKDEGQTVYAIGQTHQAYSKDSGGTWQACGQDVTASRSDTRLALELQGSRLYLATPGQGVLISTDNCGSWQPSNNGLTNLFVNTLAIDPNNPDTVYAGTDGGAYISYDAGVTWGQVNDGLLGATVVYSIAVDKDSNVYAATPYGIFKLEKK